MEGKFEKTRIQDPERAREEANMLRAEAGEAPTAEDYDKALKMLNKLQEEASQESGVGKTPEPIRSALAGFTAAGGAALDLLALSLVAGGTTIGPYPKSMAERSRRELVERFKRVGDDYKMFKEELTPAREKLERWRAEAAAREQE